MKKFIAIFISYLFIVSNSFALFDQNTNWEVRVTASAGNVNGGCFNANASGTDYSQQDEPQYIIGGITSAGAGNVLLSTSAANDWVGNGIYSVGGAAIYPNRVWQITAVTAGVDFTVVSTGTVVTIATGVVVDGVVRIGGAMSLNTATNLTDDILFECLGGSNTMWIKGGNYQFATAIVAVNPFVNTTTPCVIVGYLNTRGDNPFTNINSSSPLINTGSGTGFTGATGMNFKNLCFYGTNTTMFTLGLYGKINNCKFFNYSSAGGRVALNLNNYVNVRNVEAVSLNGTAISANSSQPPTVVGAYVHNSNVGMKGTGTTGSTNVRNSIFSSNLLYAINHDGISNINQNMVNYDNCTFYGFKNVSRSTLALISTSSGFLHLENNIFANGYRAIQGTGFMNRSNYNSNNNFYNFVSTISMYDLDYSSSFFVNPNFVDDTEIYGSTAVTNGTILMMHGGGFFDNKNITDNVDYLDYHSGTAGTPGSFLIIGHSSFSVTLNNGIGTSTNADHVFTIKTGKNFSIGTSLDNTLFPYSFVGSSTTSGGNIGAVIRSGTTSTGSSGFFIQ